MGRPKADLAFGEETMLQRVVRLLSQVVRHVVVVAAEKQSIPDFTAAACSISIARDDLEFAGPLAGMNIGLNCLNAETDCSAAYVTSCDVPFLNAEFVQELFRQIENYDIVVPVDEKHMHPLSAVYRVDLATQIEQLINDGERRPRALFDLVRTSRIPTETLATIDPELMTLANLNSPEDYADALNRADLPQPTWLTQ